MLAAMNVWLSHPILGVGLNNLSYHTNVCEFTLGWSQLIVDQGILGTILLILVFWSSIRGLNRLSKEPGLSQFWSILSLSLIFVLLCDIVNGIFTYNWIDLQRWFTLGLANFVIIRANSNLDREVSISYARDRVTSSNQTGVRLV
jgi:L-cystine uptake protein TcyP (sodium:dicarboxylate symporter family)